LAAIPLAIAAGFIAHVVLVFMASLAHGFNEVSALWASQDMAGMPVSGTYTVVITRAITAGALVVVAAIVVPSHKKIAAFAMAAVVTVASAVILTYFIYRGITSDAHIGFGVWYRSIIESIAYIIGAFSGVYYARTSHGAA
jgi:hypothetical protein